MDDLMATAEYPQSSHGQIPEQIPRESTHKTQESTQSDLVYLLDQTDWAYFSLDSSGRLIEASNRLAQLLCTTPKDLVGIPLTSLCVSPYDDLLSDHLVGENKTGAGKLQVDRLRLLLSVRPPSASGDQDHASSLARTAPSDPPSQESHAAIPIELVMVFSGDGLSSHQTGAPAAIKGLLRPVQQTPSPPGESEPEDTEESTPLSEVEQLRIHQQLSAIVLLALNQIGAINRASGLDEILVAAIETTAALVPSNHGIALMLREAQSHNLSVATFQGFEQDIIDVLPSLTLDESNQQGVSSVYLGTHPSSQEPASLLGVPLQGRKEVIGLIVLEATLPSQEICRLLQTLGDMVAIAVEKARLNEETSRRLAEVSTLYTLANQVITVLDLDRILETTTNVISRSLDCQGCCIYLQEPQTGDLILRASNGWGQRQQEAADLDLIYQVSLRAVRERQPINLASTERKKSQDPDTIIQSLLVVPLITQNTVIGTLSVDDRAPEAFGPSEGRLLTIAAAQVSVAIENARLLRNLRNRAIQLEQALDELRELHRRKTEFVQNLSHELRTPLTFVKSYVQLILEEAMGEINTDLRGALAIVDRRTDAVIRLVNDVISLEQVEMGQFEFQPISLADVATQSVEGAAVTARNAEVSIDLTAAGDLPLIPADSGRLGQVFDNLLGNAIKFSPAGSAIKVRVWRDGAYVRADVEDQGIGIPAEKLEQIFDRFYQVDGSTTRRYGGAGLGLAIVKTIVEAHGGQVAVESELGVGSIFSVFFPVPPL
jgi:signal transduction histidine kinase